jgi:hydrogenase maturation factor
MGQRLEQHFSFAGYITGFDPAAVAVGGALVQRVIASSPKAKSLVPNLRPVPDDGAVRAAALIAETLQRQHEELVRGDR